MSTVYNLILTRVVLLLSHESLRLSRLIFYFHEVDTTENFEFLLPHCHDALNPTVTEIGFNDLHNNILTQSSEPKKQHLTPIEDNYKNSRIAERYKPGKHYPWIRVYAASSDVYTYN
eukprot:snap_masked-scaffold_1-processed-gene-4.24-mRNA-1 protein AED:1.00 eAED:1.00 QI:0/0/0/0/1/1/3/0/116